MKIAYFDRKTKQQCIEKIYGQKIVALLYGDGVLRRIISAFLLPLLAHIPAFSKFYGLLQKRKGSAKKIAPFIKKFEIDTTEFLTTDFASFNDFFVRKLKPERRPIAEGSETIIMPADGRYLVYPQFSTFVVKGKTFSLHDFLQDETLTTNYLDGSMVIARLCPTDYHRFHFPCSGVASAPRLINGPLYSVNPLALKRKMAILAENKRVITKIKTEVFGTILYVEIGATSVGSIHQTFDVTKPVTKGQEKGYFEFGGSCIVLLFEKNRMIFDQDLVLNTEKGFETRALFGEPLATAFSSLSKDKMGLQKGS